MAAASSMSEREAAVYDRAIRLWGAEAQTRLMAAKLLVIGITGLTAEVRTCSGGESGSTAEEMCAANSRRGVRLGARHGRQRSFLSHKQRWCARSDRSCRRSCARTLCFPA